MSEYHLKQWKHLLLHPLEKNKTSTWGLTGIRVGNILLNITSGVYILIICCYFHYSTTTNTTTAINNKNKNKNKNNDNNVCDHKDG